MILGGLSRFSTGNLVSAQTFLCVGLCLVGGALARCGASAQGTVFFQNRLPGLIVAPIYQAHPDYPTLNQSGNGPAGFPPGEQDWQEFPPADGTNALAVLLVAPGPDAPEEEMAFVLPPRGFRTGAARGYVIPSTVTLGNVAEGQPATLKVFAWENTSGQYSSPADAWTAWKAGLIAAGMSSSITLTNVGGTNTAAPPFFGLQSFNLHFVKTKAAKR
jgi:hypothetical protein